MSSKHRSTRRSSTSKSYHSTSSSCSKPEPETWPVYSFLFTVDDVRANEDVDTGGVAPVFNPDGYWLPPGQQIGFGPKTYGTIYRWSNGTITEAREYTRTNDIWRSGDRNLVIHKCVTMFYANIFDHFRVAEGDATSYDMATADFPYNRWYPLNFYNNEEHALSNVDISADNQFLAGSAGNTRNFLHQLALHPYANREPDVPITKGLAGNLAILIGLVAFTCRHRDLTRALVNDGAWENYIWTGHTRQHVPRPERGRVISVYFDPANEVGSNVNTMYELEFGGGILIQ